MPNTVPKKPATAGSWKPGQSGNPNGRPRTGLALAEAIRSELDPVKAAQLVSRFVDDESQPLEKRLGVLLPWLMAGYLRPPTTLSLETNQASEQVDWSKLSTDELRTLADLRRKALMAGDGQETKGSASPGSPSTIDGVFTDCSPPKAGHDA